jgi:hypothetical protein
MTTMDASAYTTAYTTERPGAQFPDYWEGRDSQLATAQEYLALLEADPATDELTIAVARHAVLQRKQTLARPLPAKAEPSATTVSRETP